MIRKMRRFKQQLSDDVCVTVLENGRRGTLALSGDDGYPYAVPINYWFDTEQNRIFFHGAAEGHKMDAIRRNDRVSFNVLGEGIRKEGAWWLEFDSVTVFGRIRVVEDRDRKEAALRAIGRKYFPDEERVERETTKFLGQVCILELVPELITGKHVREN